MTEEESPGRLGRQMAAGAGWMIGVRIAIRLLGLVSTVVLARLLVPADFGLVALATTFAGALEILMAFNFEVWLIRHPNPGREHYDTVWTLSVIRGLVLGLALAVAAGPAAGFFDEPRLAGVLLVLGAAVAVGGWHNVGIYDFQRDLRFDRDFRLLVGMKLGAFVVTIALGVAFRSYWALVAGLAATHLLRLALSYFMHEYRPRFSLRRWREAFGFSKWLLVSSVLGFCYQRADVFILGKLAGAQILGLYSVALELANLAASELVTPLRRVMLPGYAKMMSSPESLRRGFIDGFAIIMLLGTPIAAGIGLTADPLVRVLLGEQWIDAIPLMRIFALYAFAAIAAANALPVLIALGRTRLVGALTAFGLALLIPVFIAAATRYGVQGAAWALGVTNVVLSAATIHAVARALSVRYGDVLSVIWRTVIATLVMAFAVDAVLGLPQIDRLWPVGRLGAAVVTGAIAYASALGILWHASGRRPGAEAAVLGLLRPTRTRKPA